MSYTNSEAFASANVSETKYTEADLKQAFLCGVKQGQGHEDGDPEPEIRNWKDCLFYQGFRNEALFTEAGIVRAQGYSLEREPGGQATATVTFVCPHCDELHSRREIYSQVPPRFFVVGYSLECGYVRVAMPWAKRQA